MIGGGITGVGAALDAASRGLRVAVVDAADLANGTSRWSSKLVHGGLRYLATGQLPIAYESALERHHLMTTIAPHIISPLRLVVPDRGPRPAISAIRAGFRAGDLLRRAVRTPSSVLPGPARISVLETLTRCPTVARAGLRGAVTSADGQLVDDARLVIALARTAAAFGAAICTYTRAERVTPDGALLTDVRTGEQFDVAARTVINATGVWADHLDPTIAIRPSRGTHLVFDAGVFGHPSGALTVPVDGSISRFVFALPEQLDRVFVGVTDVAAPGPIPDVPQPDDAEIDFLLTTINSALEQPVSRDQIIGTFAGLRPLIDPGAGMATDGALADVSRRHRVQVTDRLISVVGGKLTTYRRMAQDAVDAAVTVGKLNAGPCVTTELAVIGAVGDVPFGRYPPSTVARYGSETAALFRDARTGEASSLIADGIDVTRAEIEFAVRHEGALTVDDVLHRRTRIGLVEADARLARPAITAIVEKTLATL